MAESFKAGELFDGSRKITESTPERLALSNPNCLFVGCGVVGLILLVLGIAVLLGLAGGGGAEMSARGFGKAAKASAIYLLGGVMGLMMVTFIESLVIDGAAKVLRVKRAFGLISSEHAASDLTLAVSFEPINEHNEEPCRFQIKDSDGEVVVDFGMWACSMKESARLIAGARHIGKLLDRPVEISGQPQKPCPELSAILAEPES